MRAPGAIACSALRIVCLCGQCDAATSTSTLSRWTADMTRAGSACSACSKSGTYVGGSCTVTSPPRSTVHSISYRHHDERSGSGSVHGVRMMHVCPIAASASGKTFSIHSGGMSSGRSCVGSAQNGRTQKYGSGSPRPTRSAANASSPSSTSMNRVVSAKHANTVAGATNPRAPSTASGTMLVELPCIDSDEPRPVPAMAQAIGRPCTFAIGCSSLCQASLASIFSSSSAWASRKELRHSRETPSTGRSG